MMSGGKSIIKDKSFLFAERVIKPNQYLTEQKKEYILSKQVLRSGTAAGALVREAQNAVSNADVIHKLAIAQKGCDETIYWLEVLVATAYIEQQQCERINQEEAELLKMIRRGNPYH